jgi:hypothetical protein
MAFLIPPGREESTKTFKRRLYNTLHTLIVAERGARELRVIQLRPTIKWTRIWHNLHIVWISEHIKSTWYLVIHEIIPTNERLYAIRLTDNDRCSQCERLDTLQYRIIECKEGTAIWHWTRARIAELLRMDPRHIPAEWTIRQLLLLNPQRQERYYG